MKKSIVIMIFFITLQATAQDCERTLQQASVEFANGRIATVPKMLEKCLQRGFSNEQKKRAYLLLTECYLILGKTDKADESYLNLLTYDPEYKPTPETARIEVVYLSKKFTSTPIFEPYARISPAYFSMPTIVQNLNVNPYTIEKKARIFPGIEFGGGLNWNAAEWLTVTGELNVAWQRYKRVISGIFGSDQVTVTDANWMASLPLMVKYQFAKHKNKPYVFIGISQNYLLGSNGTFNATSYTTSNGVTTGNQTQIQTISITKNRNRLTNSLLVGGGMRFKRGVNYFFIDLRLSIGLTNLVNPDQVFYDSTNPAYINRTIQQYASVSDYFRMNTLSLSGGWCMPQYSPRKIKPNALNRFLWGLKKEKKAAPEKIPTKK